MFKKLFPSTVCNLLKQNELRRASLAHNVQAPFLRLLFLLCLELVFAIFSLLQKQESGYTFQISNCPAFPCYLTEPSHSLTKLPRN